MIQRDDITGIVLCGGAGRRMGGRDKPLELFDGRPLVAHVVARLAPQVACVVISCGRNAEQYAHWSKLVVVDDVPGQGPLRGLLTALDAIDTHYAFVCPGDAPLLSTVLVETLRHAWANSATVVCVPFDGVRTQHLFLLLRVALRDELRNHLDRGGRSVHGWLATLNTCQVDVSVAVASFRNVNSDDDLCSLNAVLAQKPHR